MGRRAWIKAELRKPQNHFKLLKEAVFGRKSPQFGTPDSESGYEEMETSQSPARSSA